MHQQAEGQPPPEYDVVILGGGPAGMTAAIVAERQGLKPLLVEKTGQIGGTAAWAAGMMWFVDSTPMASAGFVDSAERAGRYFAAKVGNSASPALQRAYIEQGRIALDYMLAHSALQVVAADYPDYYPEADGGMFGRAHAPVDFDGRTLGSHFRFLRGPIAAFAPLGGMMLNFDDIMHFMTVTRSPRSAWHIAKLLVRHAADRLRYPRGTRLVNGNALVGRLYKTIVDRQIPVWFDTTATTLEFGSGRVTGVTLCRGAETIRLTARRGIVIATGGYPANLTLRRSISHHPTDELPIALPENTGDGIALALTAGGRLDDHATDSAFYVPVSQLANADGRVTNWGHWVLDRPKPGLIAVGANGRRFTNEAASYHEFTLGMFAAGLTEAYLIVDAVAIRKYGIGAVLPGGLGLGGFERRGYLLRGRTIAELAGRIGVDAAALSATIARHNGFSATGSDDDFAKGQSAYDRFFADPAHGPNPCLGPCATAPFYAVKVMPGFFGTSRGLVTGTSGEVLDLANCPIPGLFACGNDMNSPVGGNYIGAGITLGPAITFGYLAAMALSQRPAASPGSC